MPLIHLKNQYIFAHNQYSFEEYNAGVYSGIVRNHAGDCNPPSEGPGQMTFIADPDNPNQGFWQFLGGTGITVMILDAEGHFSGEMEASGSFEFGPNQECLTSSIYIIISGTMTKETLTMDFQIDWIDLEQNPLHDPCSVVGQTCIVTGNFNGTAD